MSVALDEALFDRTAELSSLVNESGWIQAKGRLHPDEQALFLQDEVENPRFTYLSSLDTDKLLKQIDDFEREAISKADDAVISDLYKRKIDTCRVRLRMIVAAHHGRDKEFAELSHSLYGRPSARYFAYVADRVLLQCEAAQAAEPTASKRLHKVMSKIAHESHDIDVGMLPPPVEDAEVLTDTVEIARIFSEQLLDHGIDGWQIKVDDTDHRTRFAVNPMQRLIHIPSAAQLRAQPVPPTRTHVMGIAAHEVGVHARRSHLGLRSQLKLLSVGLDQYLPGEEGLAGFVQQQVEGGGEFYGFDRYLAASLALGMDGTERDFRSLFSVLRDYFLVKYAGDEMGETAVEQSAWELCVRAFRGTSGQTTGAAYTKDIVYLEGNIQMWELLTATPERFETFFVGKFNPFLKRHVTSLQTLGILE